MKAILERLAVLNGVFLRGNVFFDEKRTVR